MFLHAFDIVMIIGHISSVYVTGGSALPQAGQRNHSGGSALEEKLNNDIASKLECRHWKPGDMMFEEEMIESPDVRTFVAVDPSGRGICGIKSKKDMSFIYPSPATGNDSVDPDLHNRRIGSAMLPKALKDIRVNWPTVIAAYLDVDPRNAVAARLYYRHNFTYVTVHRLGHVLLYKYPLHDINDCVSSENMISVVWVYLIHIGSAATGAGLRSPPEGSLLKGEAHADTLINLEYRPWKPSDMMFGRKMTEIKKGRRFVAVDPYAEYGRVRLIRNDRERHPRSHRLQPLFTFQSVVGYVESKKDSLPSVLAALPDKTGHDSIVYISNVFVDPDLRNKRIA
ncbi:hypothetical protein FOZ61_000361, partial [Perkinsus olseni]